MEGTLILNEERKFVNKFRTWYKEKVYDNQVYEKTETILLKYNEYCVKTGEQIDNLGMIFISMYMPELKPFIPVIKSLLPYYWKLKKTAGELFIKGTIDVNKFIAAKFIGKYGDIKDVSIPKDLLESNSLTLKEKSKTL